MLLLHGVKVQHVKYTSCDVVNIPGIVCVQKSLDCVTGQLTEVHVRSPDHDDLLMQLAFSKYTKNSF